MGRIDSCIRSIAWVTAIPELNRLGHTIRYPVEHIRTIARRSLEEFLDLRVRQHVRHVEELEHGRDALAADVFIRGE